MLDKNKQIHYYENLLSKHGDHFLSLDWKSPESQTARFNIFADLINMFAPKSFFSVLDVGCGFGDLFGYLADKKFNFNYLGVDISSEILDSARKKHPKAAFELKDIMEDKNLEKFDFIFLSGALNISFDEREIHLEYIRSMLIRMFELCKIAAGVNFLSSQAIYYLKEEDLRHSQYFYAKPEEIVTMAKGMTNYFILRHDYHPGDFTIYLLR